MRIGLGSALVVIWVLLWGEASVANILSGVLIAAALLAAFPDDRPEGASRYVVRPIAFTRLALYFVRQLLRSNVLLAREVLSPRSRIQTGVVACPLHISSTRLVTLMTNIIALTPGTMTVEIELDPPVLYVHVLKLDSVESVRRDVARLEWLVLQAFGPPGVFPTHDQPGARS